MKKKRRLASSRIDDLKNEPKSKMPAVENSLLSDKNRCQFALIEIRGLIARLLNSNDQVWEKIQIDADNSAKSLNWTVQQIKQQLKIFSVACATRGVDFDNNQCILDYHEELISVLPSIDDEVEFLDFEPWLYDFFGTELLKKVNHSWNLLYNFYKLSSGSIKQQGVIEQLDTLANDIRKLHDEIVEECLFSAFDQKFDLGKIEEIKDPKSFKAFFEYFHKFVEKSHQCLFSLFLVPRTANPILRDIFRSVPKKLQHTVLERLNFKETIIFDHLLTILQNNPDNFPQVKISPNLNMDSLDAFLCNNSKFLLYNIIGSNKLSFDENDNKEITRKADEYYLDYLIASQETPLYLKQNTFEDDQGFHYFFVPHFKNDSNTCLFHVFVSDQSINEQLYGFNYEDEFGEIDLQSVVKCKNDFPNYHFVISAKHHELLNCFACRIKSFFQEEGILNIHEYFRMQVFKYFSELYWKVANLQDLQEVDFSKVTIALEDYVDFPNISKLGAKVDFQNFDNMIELTSDPVKKSFLVNLAKFIDKVEIAPSEGEKVDHKWNANLKGYSRTGTLPIRLVLATLKQLGYEIEKGKGRHKKIVGFNKTGTISVARRQKGNVALGTLRSCLEELGIKPCDFFDQYYD